MEPHERLKAARERAGYKTAAAFARENGFNGETYRSHETGRRGMDRAVAKQYARMLDCTWQWILFDEDSLRTAEQVQEAIEGEQEEAAAANVIPLEKTLEYRRQGARIPELDVRASAGPGALHERETIVGHWEMPIDVLRANTSAPLQGIVVATIVGDSMMPTLLPNQRVMVNTADHKPSPGGIFFMWDGLGLICKRVEYIANSNPPRVIVASDNPRYQTREMNLEDAQIQGRVIGGWQWL